MRTTISALNAGKEKIEEAKPGGLIAIATNLDPSITKADGLIGNVVGFPNKLPPVHDVLSLEYNLLERVDFENPPIKENEIFMLSVGTATTVGIVSKIKKKNVEFNLKQPVCAQAGALVALSRRIGQRWRLAGVGKVL